MRCVRVCVCVCPVCVRVPRMCPFVCVCMRCVCPKVCACVWVPTCSSASVPPCLCVCVCDPLHVTSAWVHLRDMRAYDSACFEWPLVRVYACVLQGEYVYLR